MPRTYKRRNPCIRRTRLPEQAGLGVIYNYLCQVDLKEVARGLGTTEPTVHRIVTRLQDRLLVDSYLLHVLCGLKVEGKDFIAAHAPLLAWLQDDSSKDISGLKRCLYDCPNAVDMTLTTFQAYAFSGEIEFDIGFHEMAIDDDQLFRFRKDFCSDCPNPLRGQVDVSICSAMSFGDILRPAYRSRFERHLPAMLVRSSARWRMHQALEEQRLYEHETLGEFEDHSDIRDEIIRQWLNSAVPYLRQKPL